MGSGRCDSFRWEPERKHTDAERATYWENIAMQQKSVIRQMDATIRRFAVRIAAQNKEIAEYRQCFGSYLKFSTPMTDSNDSNDFSAKNDSFLQKSGERYER